MFEGMEQRTSHLSRKHAGCCLGNIVFSIEDATHMTPPSHCQFIPGAKVIGQMVAAFVTDHVIEGWEGDTLWLLGTCILWLSRSRFLYRVLYARPLLSSRHQRETRLPGQPKGMLKLKQSADGLVANRGDFVRHRPHIGK